MTPEKTKLLAATYPMLYEPMLWPEYRYTCSSFGFEFADGWFDLVKDLSEKIEAILEKDYRPVCQCNHDRTEHYSICNHLSGEFGEIVCGCPRFNASWPHLNQAKEKFGGLRFYMSYHVDQIQKLIDEAEAHSFNVCEDCGKKGTRYSPRGWAITLCGKCYTLREKAHAEGKHWDPSNGKIDS